MDEFGWSLGDGKSQSRQVQARPHHFMKTETVFCRDLKNQLPTSLGWRRTKKGDSCRERRMHVGTATHTIRSLSRPPSRDRIRSHVNPLWSCNEARPTGPSEFPGKMIERQADAATCLNLPVRDKPGCHAECRRIRKDPDEAKATFCHDGRAKRPYFHSEVQHRPFPQRGRSPSGGNGRKAGFPARRAPRIRPRRCRLSGLSGRRNASAGAGRVRPGAARPEPGRTRPRNPFHPLPAPRSAPVGGGRTASGRAVLVQHLGGGPVAEHPARSRVQAVLHPFHIRVADRPEVRPLRQVLPDQPIGVPVQAPLPGVVGGREVEGGRTGIPAGILAGSGMDWCFRGTGPAVPSRKASGGRTTPYSLM